MKETIDTIIKWHTETFPDATLDGQIAKWEEEKQEYEHTGYNTEEELYELADMIIVSAGIARFDYTYGIGLFANIICLYGYAVDDIWQAVEKKMEINKKRTWQESNGSYHHIEKGNEND